MSEREQFPAGDYELVAPFWEEYLSKPGQPLDFVRHYRGDTVTLGAAEARRLGLAGAVKVPGADKPAAPGSGPSVAPKGSPDSTTATKPPAGPASDKIDDIVEFVGDDAEKAAAWLQAEEQKEQPRSTLIEKLEAVVSKSGNPDS